MAVLTHTAVRLHRDGAREDLNAIARQHRIQSMDDERLYVKLIAFRQQERSLMESADGRTCVTFPLREDDQAVTLCDVLPHQAVIDGIFVV